MRSASRNETLGAWSQSDAPTVEVSEATLDAMLRRALQTWGRLEPDEPFLVTHILNSRTATLYRCRAAGAPFDIVVKVGDGWHPSDAFDSWVALTRLNDVLSTFPPDPVALPGPFGWDPSPPAVFTRHIEGTDLYHLMQDPDHEGWAATQWSPEELAGLCGRALGTFHSFMEPVPGPAGMDVLHEATSSVYLSAGTVRELERHVSIAPSFGDFGVHQFRLGTDDVLYLLDPPTTIDLAPVHRDIATFAFHIAKVVETRSLGERRHSSTALCEAFYAGYSETGPTDLRIPVNRWLVTIFAGRAARGLAHKRLRSWEPILALRNTELWLRAIAAAHFRKPYFQ